MKANELASPVHTTLTIAERDGIDLASTRIRRLLGLALGIAENIRARPLREAGLSELLAICDEDLGKLDGILKSADRRQKAA